ncbi:MAG: hypothetical protein PVJ86_09900 [Phycisphaerales bacterium]|jgi:hypothetical protein
MKRHLPYVGLLILCVGIVLLSSGCAVDLFDSEHKHYHSTEETEERIQNLEERVETLEAEQSNQQ